MGSLCDSKTDGREGGVDSTDEASACGHLAKVTKGGYSIWKLEMCRGSAACCTGWRWLGTNVLIVGEDVVGIEDGAGLVPKQMCLDWGKVGEEISTFRVGEKRSEHIRAAAQAGVTCMSFSSAIASRKVM